MRYIQILLLVFLVNTGIAQTYKYEVKSIETKRTYAVKFKKKKGEYLISIQDKPIEHPVEVIQEGKTTLVTTNIEKNVKLVFTFKEEEYQGASCAGCIMTIKN